MFDTKDGNALQDLAANGASPNAFTSSAITGYYFECTEKFEENLRILLTFVSVPYFSQESVDKEQGIIGQEIRMIEDNPNWQAFTNLMSALYQQNPIRNSVAGTQESISYITAETLYRCHEAFYHPGNMVLCVAGNVEPDKVCAMAREILPPEGRPFIPRDYGNEPETVSEPLREMLMEVATPILQLGFKVRPAETGEASMRQNLLGDLACEALMGTSSPLYAKLYREGLLNSSFFYGYEEYPGCTFLIAGGESRDPAAVRDAILAEGKRIGREGLDDALFHRLKKAAYGNQVRALNSFEHICIEQAQASFREQDIWTFPEVYQSLSKGDAEDFIRTWIQREYASLAVIRPGEADV